MKIIFIRHAAAVKEFDGLDLDRPLKEKSIQKAKIVFERYKKIYKKLDLIISSQAVRSKQTAELLSKSFGNTKIKSLDLINPTCDYESFKSLLASLESGLKQIAIVAHEPDLSHIVSKCVTGGGILYINIKNLAAVEVDMGVEAKGELISFISPKHLKPRKNRV